MTKWFMWPSVVFMAVCANRVSAGEVVSRPDQAVVQDVKADDPQARDSKTRELLELARKSASGDLPDVLQRALASGRGERWVVAEGAQIVTRLERKADWRYDPAKQPIDLSLALARGWREGGNLRKAAECYRAVLVKQPESREAVAGQILTLARLLDDPRGLLDEVELALFRQPADVELRVAKADMQRRLGQKDLAMAACDEILSGHPDSWDARALKARLLVEFAGGVASRPGLFEEALRLSGNAPDIRAEYVKALATERRAEDALAQYGLLPDAFPLSQDVLRAVARSLQVLGRGEEAAILVGLALRKQAGDPDLQDLSVADVKECVRRDMSEQKKAAPGR